MVTSTNSIVEKGTDEEDLDVGLLPSYFAADIQWKSRGFMAHTIYKLLEKTDNKPILLVDIHIIIITDGSVYNQL